MDNEHYYHDPDLGWMPRQEYLDQVLAPFSVKERNKTLKNDIYIVISDDGTNIAATHDMEKAIGYTKFLSHSTIQVLNNMTLKADYIYEYGRLISGSPMPSLNSTIKRYKVLDEEKLKYMSNFCDRNNCKAYSAEDNKCYKGIIPVSEINICSCIANEEEFKEYMKAGGYNGII